MNHHDKGTHAISTACLAKRWSRAIRKLGNCRMLLGMWNKLGIGQLLRLSVLAAHYFPFFLFTERVLLQIVHTADRALLNPHSSSRDIPHARNHHSTRHIPR
ncbi:MAG: hypothetical protein HXS40_12000 [Theionarchaea archaeon]|nr:hypothetical protein [Theionarchaea archaeon]